MGHEVLQDTLGTVGNVHVAPVHPGVIGLQSGVEEVIPGTGDSLASWTLCGERVSLRHSHLNVGTEVLLDNGCAAEANFLLGVVLDAIEFGGEVGEGVVLAVTNKEGQIDQIVWVGKFVKEVEVFGQVRSGITKRGQDEYTFAVESGLGGGLDGVQVEIGDSGGVDFVGFVAVKEDGGLGVGTPFDHLVNGHLHG